MLLNCFCVTWLIDSNPFWPLNRFNSLYGLKHIITDLTTYNLYDCDGFLLLDLIFDYPLRNKGRELKKNVWAATHRCWGFFFPENSSFSSKSSSSHGDWKNKSNFCFQYFLWNIIIFIVLWCFIRWLLINSFQFLSSLHFLINSCINYIVSWFSLLTRIR